MVVSPVDAFLLVSGLSGVAMCVIAADTYRRWDQPGTRAFVAFVAVMGVGLVVTAGVGSVGLVLDDEAPLWSPLAVMLWGVSIVPWIAFALQYTGTYTRINRRTTTLFTLPAIGFPLVFANVVDLGNPVFTILGSLSALYLVALMIVGCFLVVRTANRYGHLTLRQGAVLAAIPLLMFVSINFSAPLFDAAGEAAAAGVYAAGAVGVVGSTTSALYRYDTFQSTPAVGTIGERAIVRQTEDLMFVVDDDGRIIRLNRTAADRLEVSKTEVLGEDLAELIGATVEDLHGMETIELLTDEGRRQFDPVLSRLTDQHGRRLGHTLSLHDVTELEMREQRLEVLNRVLRHNLRNQVEVIRSNAEHLAVESQNGYAESIIESADRLTQLGRSARSIDRVVSQPSSTSEVDVAAVVYEAVEGSRRNDGVDLSVSVPDSAGLVTERQALVAAAESAVESARSRASATVSATLEEIPSGYCLTVADDGPGIPEEELASVSEGTETALKHATGLGLWQLKWAVTKCNGDLSIENDDGTTVEIRIPDQAR